MEAVKTFFWGKSPEKLLEELRRDVLKESRQMDISINNMSKDEIKKRNEMRKNAQKGFGQLVKENAKQIIKIQKSIVRLSQTKDRLGNLSNIMREMVANYKVKKTVEKSARLMATLNGLMSVGEVATTMRHFSMQLEKAGFIEEQMQDAMEAADDDDVDDEEEADEQIQKIYDEMSIDFEAGAPVIRGKEPNKKARDDIDEFKRRLEQLKN